MLKVTPKMRLATLDHIRSVGSVSTTELHRWLASEFPHVNTLNAPWHATRIVHDLIMMDHIHRDGESFLVK